MNLDLADFTCRVCGTAFINNDTFDRNANRVLSIKMKKHELEHPVSDIWKIHRHPVGTRTYDDQDAESIRTFAYKLNPIWVKHQLKFLEGDRTCGECREGPFRTFRDRDKHSYDKHGQVVVR